MTAFLLYQFAIKLVYALSGLTLGVLGYKLYIKGVQSHGEISGKSQFGQFMATGQGPGLFFIIASAVIITTNIFVNTPFRYREKTPQGHTSMSTKSKPSMKRHKVSMDATKVSLPDFGNIDFRTYDVQPEAADMSLDASAIDSIMNDAADHNQ